MAGQVLKELVSEIEAAIASGSPTLQSTISVAGTQFRVRIDPGDRQSFKLEPTASTSFDSRTVLESILGKLGSKLPDLSTNYMTLNTEATTGAHVLQLPLKNGWNLPLGITSLQITNLLVSVIENPANLGGDIKGQCQICGRTTNVEIKLPGDVTISGTIPPIDLMELITSIAGPILKLPTGTPTFGLRESTFSVLITEDLPVLVLRTSSGDFRGISVVVANVDGKWQAVAQIPLPVEGVFSKLSPSLGKLDNLLPVESPRLLLSSFDTTDFSLPLPDGVQLDKVVGEGLSLLASLMLQGGLLGFFGKLLGMSQLPLTLSASDSLQNSTINAHRDGALNLVPGFLTIRDFSVSILPATQTIEPNAHALVTLLGFSLPLFRVSGSVSPEDPTPTLKLVTEQPFDLKALPLVKVSVLKAGLSINPEGPDYGVLCDIQLAGKEGKSRSPFDR